MYVCLSSSYLNICATLKCQVSTPDSSLSFRQLNNLYHCKVQICTDDSVGTLSSTKVGGAYQTVLFNQSLKIFRLQQYEKGRSNNTHIFQSMLVFFPLNQYLKKMTVKLQMNIFCWSIN